MAFEILLPGSLLILHICVIAFVLSCQGAKGHFWLPYESVEPHIPSPPPVPLSHKHQGRKSSVVHDCSSLVCNAPLTNTPAGLPCGCVWPIQVGLRLSLPLYTLFPLVPQLTKEIAKGVSMRRTQLRVIGATCAIQQPEKTTVLIDMVPLKAQFDVKTVYLTYYKIWHKQVAINSSVFGDYEVLYIKYPGLPPSPL